METYWVPGVNNLKTFGRWAFAEFADVYQMESEFEAKVAQEFERILTETAPVVERVG
jgi:type III restriction enzyme